MTGALITSVLVGLGVGAAHYAGHVFAGEEMAFEDAGVDAAGITVVAAATAAAYILLTVSGVA